MIIDIDDEELAVFIRTGKGKGKLYKSLRSNKSFMRSLNDVINTLSSVDCIEDLHAFRSLNYEHLKGDRKEQSSVRIGYSSPYRLIFTEHDGGIRILIIEISNHYGDH